LTAIQKVGYDGPFMLEINAQGSTKETLARARQTRQRMDKLLAT
jgi:hydroxypyruvate isomerase